MGILCKYIDIITGISYAQALYVNVNHLIESIIKLFLN